MKKNVSTILLLAGAVATGGLGWYLAQNYVNNQVKDYQVKVEKQLDTIPIVVASRELAPGEFIDETTVSIRQVPKAYAPTSAVDPSAFDSIKGKQVLYAIGAGDAVTPSYLAKVSSNNFSSLLKPGERALTVPVDSKNSISGFLKPGDNIDLFLTYSDTSTQSRTLPLLSNVKVLATGVHLEGEVSSPQSAGDNQYSEITIGVTPRDAGRVIHGQSLGSLTVALRPKDEASSDYKDYVSIDNLTDIKFKPPAPPPAPAPVPSAGPSAPTFQVIRGGKT